MSGPNEVVWTQHLPGETRVHRYDHGTLDLPDRRVGDYDQWLTACGKVPVKYRLRGSGIVRSAGAELTEAQAQLLGLEFCTVCFGELETGTPSELGRVYFVSKAAAQAAQATPLYAGCTLDLADSGRYFLKPRST